MLLWEFSHWAEVFPHCVQRQKMLTAQLLPMTWTETFKLTNFSLFCSGIGPLSHQRARETGCAGALFLLRSLCSFISTAVWMRCMENMDNRKKRYYCMTYSVWNIRVTPSAVFLEADINHIPFDMSDLNVGSIVG